MSRLLLILALLVGIYFGGFSQSTEAYQHQTYYYTVENVASEDQLNEVYQEFESLKFVTKVKLNFKPEKGNKAQFIVYVSEPKRSSESQQMFELTDLKKIIVNHNLQPADLKIDTH